MNIYIAVTSKKNGKEEEKQPKAYLFLLVDFMLPETGGNGHVPKIE